MGTDQQDRDRVEDQRIVETVDRTGSGNSARGADMTEIEDRPSDPTTTRATHSQLLDDQPATKQTGANGESTGLGGIGR